MKEHTAKFLDKLRCEKLRYYTIEDGKGVKPDIVTVAYFAGNMYDIKIYFLFNEGYIEVRISGVENIPIYKKGALIDGINDLYMGYKWLDFTIERNKISAKIDTHFGIEDAVSVCYKIIDKISGIVGSSKRSGYLW